MRSVDWIEKQNWQHRGEPEAHQAEVEKQPALEPFSLDPEPVGAEEALKCASIRRPSQESSRQKGERFLALL